MTDFIGAIDQGTTSSRLTLPVAVDRLWVPTMDDKTRARLREGWQHAVSLA